MTPSDLERAETGLLKGNPTHAGWVKEDDLGADERAWSRWREVNVRLLSEGFNQEVVARRAYIAGYNEALDEQREEPHTDATPTKTVERRLAVLEEKSWGDGEDINQLYEADHQFDRRIRDLEATVAKSKGKE